MNNYHKQVYRWLFVGILFVLIQTVIGGVTRLTGSGLSITKWEIITGTIPPMTNMAWEHAFSLYKESPQYAKLNEGMSMASFKFIYFWEYFHRLWARMLGLVFVIPFVIFIRKKMLSKYLIKRLIITVVLVALVASFGWIMVASGLADRPWVNAYKLALHLSLALLVLTFHVWTTMRYRFGAIRDNSLFQSSFFKSLLILFSLIWIQIFFGGVVSGMHAALAYPSFPTYNGDWIPGPLLDRNSWNWLNMMDYDRSGFAAALVQFVHRNTAYLITMLIVAVSIIYKERIFMSANVLLRKIWNVWLGILICQIALGIATLLNSTAKIPVLLGVLHQFVGILFLTGITVILYFGARSLKNDETDQSIGVHDRLSNTSVGAV